jgi:hypothetical protein
MQYISGLMCFTTGIVLAGVRLMEPLFRLLVVKRFYQFFGIVVDHTGDDEKGK